MSHRKCADSLYRDTQVLHAISSHVTVESRAGKSYIKDWRTVDWLFSISPLRSVKISDITETFQSHGDVKRTYCYTITRRVFGAVARQVTDVLKVKLTSWQDDRRFDAKELDKKSSCFDRDLTGVVADYAVWAGSRQAPVQPAECPDTPSQAFANYLHTRM